MGGCWRAEGGGGGTLLYDTTAKFDPGSCFMVAEGWVEGRGGVLIKKHKYDLHNQIKRNLP